MAFKKIESKHDCKDFKPFFLNCEFCKLTFKCANAGNKYIILRNYDARGLFDCRCTGMMKSNITILPKAAPNFSGGQKKKLTINEDFKSK